MRKLIAASFLMSFCGGLAAFALTPKMELLFFRHPIISWVSDGGYSTNSASPLAALAPKGVSVGDSLVMCANVQTTVAQGTLTTPAGWTLVGTGSTGAGSDGGTGFVNTYLFHKIAVAADMTAASYNVAYNTGGTLGNIAANIRAYRGTKAVSPLNTAQFVLTAGNVLTSVVPVFSETFVPGEIYVGCSASDINVDMASTQPQLVHVFDPAPFTIRIYMGDYIPTGIPSAETYTYQNTAMGRTGWGVTIKPIP